MNNQVDINLKIVNSFVSIMVYILKIANYNLINLNQNIEKVLQVKIADFCFYWVEKNFKVVANYYLKNRKKV